MDSASSPIASPDHQPIRTDLAAVLDEALGTVSQELVVRVVRRRLKRFLSLLPGVLGSEDPETVHDLRVWSRRLQQGLVMPFPKPKPRRVRRLRRTLRQLRRTLGGWRNCDVHLELAARESRRTRSPARQRAWSLFREHLSERRGNLVAVARQDLLRRDLAKFAVDLEKLWSQPLEGGAAALAQSLRSSFDAAWAQWESALAHAQATRQPTDIHRFRIATKRLRYRSELLRDLGHQKALPLLSYLKEIQGALGKWHDRQAFYRAVAEAVARPDFLLLESSSARILLAQMDKGAVQQAASLDDIFRRVGEYGNLSRGS